MRKIAVFTGTRAEYGLLKPVMEHIRRDAALQLQLIVGGMHLCEDFGATWRLIEADGFFIDAKVDMQLTSDRPEAVCRSLGLGVAGCGETLQRLAPDILVVLGDRFEAFAAAAAAMFCSVPVAHIHGGEATYGAVDEYMRHAITKMSHLHFACAEEYRQRIIQLGEHPGRVFNVGALGVENIKQTALLGREQLEREIEFELGSQSALITFHPATLEEEKPEEQFRQLLAALEKFPDLRFIFTKANADVDGQAINRLIENHVAGNRRAVVFASMGQLRYLSALRHVSAVVGNSSSGIIEAPSLGTPTVNIGDRQKGRIRCQSVIDCLPRTESIVFALKKALSSSFKSSLHGMCNPYEKEQTSLKIKETLKNADLEHIRRKEFFSLEWRQPEAGA